MASHSFRTALAVALCVLAPAPPGHAAVPTITTFAGSLGTGPARAVGMHPYDIAYAGGAVYLADAVWHVVRRIDPATRVS